MTAVPEALTEKRAREWLRRAARRVPGDQAIVEVGVHQGSSLLALAQGADEGDGARVYGIDPWAMDGAYPGRPHMVERYGLENMRVAEEALAALGVDALLVRDFGVAVARHWEGPKVGLLFIDAVHREREVTEDFLAWRPHLAKGAIVAFDDYSPRFGGVMRAVDRLFPGGVNRAGSRVAWVKT